MDKLVKHGIRMLEIVEGENDFFRNDAKRQADIARAVYDTILRVQALERKADRKTEPKTQTETQNSNVTFEKRTMRDCYNCKRYETEGECVECHYEPKDECAKEYEELGLKELKELIEADRKTENSSEIPNNCEHITEDGVTCAKYPACDDCLDNPLNNVKGSERLVKSSEQTDLVEDSPSLVKDLVKAFGEDGTWLERQGVYTLTLAEAKQRAVDIIESVLAKDEPQNYCDDCLYTDTCDSKEFFYACTSKATCSKMEQVEDEPQTDCDKHCVQTEVGCEQTDCAWRKGE